MSMNLDDPNDYRELSIEVKNYIMAEFVAVPPDFDLKSHLSMREQVGIFEVKDIDINQANIFIDSIKSSPIFSTLNNALIHPRICFFILNLFNELNLVLKTVDNPLRRYMDKHIYRDIAKTWENGRLNHIRGQDVQRVSFLVVNVVHLFNENIYKEALTAMESIHQFQKEIDSQTFKL